jgi:hypothetical protein
MNDSISPPPSAKNVPLPTGLTSVEASSRLQKSGPNATPDTSLHSLRRALTKFWAPVPWVLEAAIVLEVVLGKHVEAGIIAILLAFNTALGFFQEGRAQATLAALKSRLALNATVKRDNAWKTVPATELVVGDLVKLSLGAVVADDVRLTEREILLDQSMLTGESIPIEAGVGLQTYVGALVRRGDATAEVTATGGTNEVWAYGARPMRNWNSSRRKCRSIRLFCAFVGAFMPRPGNGNCRRKWPRKSPWPRLIIHWAYSLHELKRTKEARAVLLPMADKFPDQYIIPYNLACYCCQLGELKESLQWLGKAIDLAGKKEIRLMALEDPDLEPLRKQIKAG